MRWRTTAFVLAQALVATSAAAQPDLPPPPPPPIEPIPEAPPTPPPASSPPASQPRPAPPAGTRAPERRGAPRPVVVPAPPPPYRVERVERVEHPSRRAWRPAIEERRPVAVTFNPLPLLLGRVSGNVEVRLAAHHALVASANVLLAGVDRGGDHGAGSDGVGFATTGSSGGGVELGYHYWWHARAALRGVFFGPSLLLGGTSQATVGDSSRVQSYWGAALDGGVEDVFAGGFTLGAGAGIGVLRMAGVTTPFPRVLLQIGWSL